MNMEHQDCPSPAGEPTAPARLAETDFSQYAILNPWEPSRSDEAAATVAVYPQEEDQSVPFLMLDYVPALGALGAVILATCVFAFIVPPPQPAPPRSATAPPAVQAELPEPEPRPVSADRQPGFRVLTEGEKAAMRQLEQELSSSDSGAPTGWDAEDETIPATATERNRQARQNEQEKLQESFSSVYWQRLQDIIRQEKTLLRPLPANPGLTKARELLDQRAAAASRTVAQLDALQPQYVDPEILGVAARVRNWYGQSLQLVADGRSVFAQGGAPLAEWHQRDAAHRQDFLELLNAADTVRGRLTGKYRQVFGRLNTGP